MKKIRVLEVLPDLGSGGAEGLVVNLARNIDRNKFTIELLTLYGRKDSHLERVAADENLKVSHLDKTPGPDPSLFFKLTRFINRNNLDVVHSHLYVLRYLLPAIYLFRKIKFFHTVHNIADKEVTPLGRVFNRLSFWGGVTPVAISDNIRKSIEELYAPPTVPVIPNGIQIDAIRTPSLGNASWRQQEGFSEDDILIATVARLSPQKNHRLLIEAFARTASRQGEGVKLLLVGEGPLKKELQNLTNELGIADKVYFLGLRQDIPAILNAADLFVLSSNYEGNPLSVMEAMAAGTVPVCTSVGGVPELIENGKSGLLVPPGDEGELCRALEVLLNSRQRRQELSAQAAQTALQRFDISKMVEHYQAIFASDGHEERQG